MNTEVWDYKEYSGDADQKAGGVDEKGAAGLAKTIDYTCQGTVCVEERTDPGKSDHEFSGGLAVEQCDSDPVSEEEKNKTAGKTQNKTGTSHFLDDIHHFSTVFRDLYFCDCRHQHDRDGTCYSGWEQDAGKCHTVEDSVQAEGFGCIVMILLETAGNGNCFNTLQQVDQNAVCCQRQRKRQQFAQSCRQYSGGYFCLGRNS